MQEILRHVAAGAFVLDLGSGAGSFDAAMTAAHVVRFDREVRSKGLAVEGDAARLPFPDGTFRAVIANHTFEHFDDLPAVLIEVRRVLQPTGALFVSVPDASTLCDRLYRWLADGGGHVNPFVSAEALARMIEEATGLKHVATRTLYSSLAYLNRKNARARAPRRLWLVGGGYEWTLFLFAWLSRKIDRSTGLRWSVYGWAMYFGEVAETVDTQGWINVCLRCGSGASSAVLRRGHMAAARWWMPARYTCAACGTVNPWMADR